MSDLEKNTEPALPDTGPLESQNKICWGNYIHSLNAQTVNFTVYMQKPAELPNPCGSTRKEKDEPDGLREEKLSSGKVLQDRPPDVPQDDKFLEVAPKAAAPDRSMPPPTLSRVLHVQPDMMETHREIIIKIKIPEEFNIDDLSLSVSETHVTVQWTTCYMEQLIPLPSGIRPDDAKASIADSVLEIRIPKIHPENSKEIGIRKP